MERGTLLNSRVSVVARVTAIMQEVGMLKDVVFGGHPAAALTLSTCPKFRQKEGAGCYS